MRGHTGISTCGERDIWLVPEVSEAMLPVLVELRRECDVFSETSLRGEIGPFVNGSAGTTPAPDGGICVVYRRLLR